MEVKCSAKLKTETSMMKFEEHFLDKSKSSLSKGLINKKTAHLEVYNNRSLRKEEDDIKEQLHLYKCEICEKALSDAESLEDHFKQIHNSNLAFVCHTCFERYPEEEMLNQHKHSCNK